MSTEEKNEPNGALYDNWEKVFRKIEGFQQAVCLRRVRAPGHTHSDMDFLLLQPGPLPKLGLVECEGFDSPTACEKRVASKWVKQPANYANWFKPDAGNGKHILSFCIENAFKPSIDRGRLCNIPKWKSIENWFASAGAKSTDDGLRLLDEASKNLVPILLFYRKSKLTAPDFNVLASAMPHRPFYVGAVNWPEASSLMGGKYL